MPFFRRARKCLIYIIYVTLTLKASGLLELLGANYWRLNWNVVTLLPSVFYYSFFVAADKLQYQSLDAVNKEGMFVPATNFLQYDTSR